MSDRAEEIMDLDLNLGPGTLPNVEMGHSSEDAVNVSDSDWVEPSLDDAIREIFRERVRLRRLWRYHQLPSGPESLPLVGDSDRIGGVFGVGLGVDGESNGGGSLQTGEGSVTAEERNDVKKCEGHLTLVENASVDEEGGVDKSLADEGSFFDCNICLDLARDPIVTCCGHLFCWPCIYRWLHIYGEAKECPVCKGEVTLKNITPIYGRGNHTTHELEEELEVKIPERPSARRVESLRQTIQRRAPSFPVEEMIQRLGARFELTRDSFQFSNTDRNLDLIDRTTRLSRILNALRREQSQPTTAPPSPSPSMQNVVDLTQDRPETVPIRRHPPLNGRGQITRDYYDRQGQSEELQPGMVDDRDSVSSIAAVIHGESQTVDTTLEIDSGVSLSTSSSIRRNDASRSSDVDSVDSRSLRRRRLN